MSIPALRAAIRELGFKEIQGSPRGISQFGVPYVMYHNGYVSEAGVIDQQTKEEMWEKAFMVFKILWNNGERCIVWRIEPEFNDNKLMPRLYMRFHTLKEVPEDLDVPEVTLEANPAEEYIIKQDIGWAVQQLRRGKRVARTGWNGRGMYIELQVPDEFSKMTLPYVFMSTVQGSRVPWLCSQTDLLAADWVEVH